MRILLSMKHAAVTWTLVAIAALLVGPLAGWLCAPIHGFDGGRDAAALLSTAPLASMLRELCVVLLGVVYGCAAGKVRGYKVGLFCCGLIIAWGAWHSARVDDIIRAQRAASALWLMSLETLILALGALVGAYLIVRTADARAIDDPRRPRFISDNALGVAVAAGVGGVVAWGIARSAMVGQTFAAATIGAVMGTLVARIVAVRSNVLSSLMGILAAAVVGPIMAVVVNSQTLVADMYAGNLFALARPAPLDWLAGALVGLPIGLSWSNSMIERHVPEEQRRALQV